MDADFQLGLNLLKKFREEIKRLAEASDETALIEAIEVVKEPIRNAAYRIKQGSGPMKEELLSALLVLVREFREYQNPDALRKEARRVLELVENFEKAAAGS
ncbi:MAG: hypothetical protein GXN96_00810 [Aquificae bacterium]|nr:hypothetical protein [Aquificota bacterium]